MEAAGLASSIITFLDVTAKIVSRVVEYSKRPDGPAYLQAIGTQVPLVSRTLEVIKKQALSNTLAPDICTELQKVVINAKAQIEQLYTCVCLLQPRTTSQLQKFNVAVRSVLKYDDKIEEILGNLKGFVDTLNFFQITATAGKNDEIFQTLNAVQDGQLDALRQREYEHASRWIDGMPRDPYIDICDSRRAAGTCDWVFKSTAYIRWISNKYHTSNPKILWINGAPGTGKTFLSTRIFTALEPIGEAAAVFWTSEAKFANAALDEIPRSWLAQLLIKNADHCEHVKQGLSNRKSDRASTTQVWDALRSVLLATPNITLVLDGLDEYSHQQARRNGQGSFGHRQNIQFETIQEFLRLLKDVLRGVKCRLLCVSQPHADIRSELASSRLIADEGITDAFEHSITVDDIAEDLSAFANLVIEKQLPQKDSVLRMDLAKMVADKAEGQMLWIGLIEQKQDYLRPSFRDSKCLKIVADTMPGVDSLYSANMQRIAGFDSNRKTKAFRILHWILYAQRELTVHELVEAILIEDNEDLNDFPDDDLPEDPSKPDVYRELQELCGNFIQFETDEERAGSQYWKVRFAHSSIRQYLSSHLEQADSVYHLAATSQSDSLAPIGVYCLRYLMCSNVWPDLKPGIEPDSVILEEHPFLTYAASFLSQHLNSRDEARLNPLLHDYLIHHFQNHQKWMDATKMVTNCSAHGLAAKQVWNWSSNLSFASSLGLRQIMEEICANTNVRPEAKDIQSAAIVACWYGDASLLNILEDAGADVTTSKWDNSSSCLHAASWRGHAELVKYVLSKGADVNVVLGNGDTALHSAARCGKSDIVTILLANGADPSIANANGIVPLYDAVIKQDAASVKILLESDMVAKQTVNHMSHHGWTCLMAAGESGSKEIVEILLCAGADPLPVGSWGRTAMYTTAIRGNYEIFSDLLKCCEDIPGTINKVTHWNGYSLLIASVQSQNLCIVKSLVGHGADVYALDYDCKSALDWAILKGAVDVAEYLITEAGALENPDNISHETTPLMGAAKAGATGLVKLLLNKGADVKMTTESGCTCLEMAAQAGPLEAVQSILDHPGGLDTLNNECEAGLTPLGAACAEGNLEIALLLLRSGADPLAVSSDHYSILDRSALGGSFELVDYLVDTYGASIRSEHVLHGAAEGGNWEMFSYLRQDHAIDSATKYDCGSSILHYAAYGGNLRIIEAVLKDGDTALLSAKNSDGQTALWVALCEKNLAAAKRLLKEYGRRVPPLTFCSDDVFEAVACGDIAFIRALVDYDRNAFMKARGRDEITPLIEACCQGKANVMDFLIAEGSSIMEKSSWNCSVLHFYASNGHASTARFFKDINWEIALAERTKSGSTPILYAAKYGQSDPFRRFVAKVPASIYHRQKTAGVVSMTAIAWQGASTLHMAASSGNTEMVQMIVDICGEVCLSWRDDYGAYPVHYAIGVRDNAYLLEYLHGLGARLDVSTYTGITPLNLASGYRAAAAYLIKQGLAQQDQAARKYLRDFIWGSDSLPTVQLLLKHGCKLADFAAAGETSSMHIAASEGDEKLISFLIDQGQSWDTEDLHCWTPRDCLLCTDRKRLKSYGDEANKAPRAWKRSTKWAIDSQTGSGFVLTGDETRAKLRCNMKQAHSQAMCGITAEHYLLPTVDGSYFEVTIISCPPTNRVAVGIDAAIEGRDSIGPNVVLFLGDSGYVSRGLYDGDIYSKHGFGQGDTIGCGIDYEAGSLFFTKNGKCLGTVHSSARARFAPVAYTMEDDGVEFEANFGQKPFLFDNVKHYGNKGCTKCYSSQGKLKERYGEYMKD